MWFLEDGARQLAGSWPVCLAEVTWAPTGFPGLFLSWHQPCPLVPEIVTSFQGKITTEWLFLLLFPRGSLALSSPLFPPTENGRKDQKDQMTNIKKVM